MGEYNRARATYPRFYTEAGELVLTEAEAMRAKAATAEAEVARLRALLTRKGIAPNGNNS